MRKYVQLAVVLLVFLSAVFFRHLSEAEPRTVANAEPAAGGEPGATPTPTPQPAPALPPAPLPAIAEASQPAPIVEVVTAPPLVTISAATTWPTYFVGSVFKDGLSSGKPARINYGDLQIQLDMQSGRIEDIVIAQYPLRTPTSERMSKELIPRLVSQALAIQDWDVDAISGATQTSEAFRKALVYALREAEQH